MQLPSHSSPERPVAGRMRLVRMAGLLAVAALLAVAVILSGSISDARASVTTTGVKPRPPAQGVALGAYVGLPGATGAEALRKREKLLRRTFAIGHHYYDWADPFPGALETADVSNRRAPMITWWGTRLADILSGSQDALIRARAAAVRAFGRPVFIRWAAEMNGNWFAWSGTANGNDPSLFVAAWRRIHGIFAAAGATNVAWVWAPNADSKPGGTDTSHWNNWRNYYPGDAYVDWVGIDGYNWGSIYGWQEFGRIFEPVYRDYAARKPIMIAETSSIESGGSKATWIDNSAAWMRSHPAVKALVWFDTNTSSTSIDWRIDSSSGALSAFRRLAKSSYFAPMF